MPNGPSSTSGPFDDKQHIPLCSTLVTGCLFVGRVDRRDQLRNIVEFLKLNPSSSPRQTVVLLGSEKRFLQAPQRICINQFSS